MQRRRRRLLGWGSDPSPAPEPEPAPEATRSPAEPPPVAPPPSVFDETVTAEAESDDLAEETAEDGEPSDRSLTRSRRVRTLHIAAPPVGPAEEESVNTESAADETELETGAESGDGVTRR